MLLRKWKLVLSMLIVCEAAVRRDEMDEVEVQLSVIHGAEAVFECPFPTAGNQQSRRDRHNFTWLRKPRQIIVRNHFKVTKDERFTTSIHFASRSSTLKINPVKLSDHGSYVCSLQVDDKIYSRQFSLEVLVEPQLIAKPTLKSRYVEGDTLDARCVFEGVPRPTVVWFFASPAVSRREVQEDELHLPNLHRDNSGNYTCEGSNGVGKASSYTFQVDVSHAPEAKVVNRLIKQEVGQDTMFQCQLTAWPLREPRWFRGHTDSGSWQRIMADECSIHFDRQQKFCLENNPKFGVHHTITSTLHLFDVQQTDYMDYNCTVVNEIGSASATVSFRQYEAKKGWDILARVHEGKQRQNPVEKKHELVESIKSWNRSNGGSSVAHIYAIWKLEFSTFLIVLLINTHE